MKSLFYRLFALFFKISRILPVKDNRVAFVSMHNEGFNDSLGSIRSLLEKTGGFELVYINKNDLSSASIKAVRFFLVCSRQLATAKYVFLNDNFLPMSMLSFSDKTVVTQLWHAEGVFKKFGLSIPQSESVRKHEIEANKRISYVVCSSKSVVPYYAEAFGVEEDRVLPLGSARTDMLYTHDDIGVLKEKFYKQYPESRGKKLVLYAPTFRDDPEYDKKLLDNMDTEKFNRVLGEEYSLAIRLHPQLHAAERSFKNAIDLTEWIDPVSLVLISDVLITDYSSICMDFALLDKPVVFYAFDLDYYNGARSFYFDYESYVPGKVVKDMDALINTFKSPHDMSKLQTFKKFNFDIFDGKAAQRIVDRVIYNGNS